LNSLFANHIQFSERFVRQFEVSRPEVLVQVIGEEVPGMRRTFDARRSSQASATCMGVAPSSPATSERVDDCSGVKPPRGKKGT